MKTLQNNFKPMKPQSTEVEEVSVITPEQRAKINQNQMEVIKNTLLDEVTASRKQIAAALVSSAKDGNVMAIKEILERTLGKVKEDFNITAKIEQNVNITDDRFNQIIQIRAKRIENPTS